MEIKESFLKLLHRIYRKSEFIAEFIEAVESLFTKIQIVIQRLEFLLHFNRLDEQGCEWWEHLLDISNVAATLSDRRANIRAKFIICVHNDIVLLQKACDSWKNGEVEVGFKGGKIQIQFVGSFGVPSDLDSLKKTIGEIKPAHLPIEWLYRYLLKKEIHHVLTKAQMQQYKKNQYCNVKTKK